jgi:hypothetical protein
VRRNVDSLGTLVTAPTPARVAVSVAASDLAKGCPLLSSGGTVEVYEIVPAM